jgi:hypothetical protein
MSCGTFWATATKAKNAIAAPESQTFVFMSVSSLVIDVNMNSLLKEMLGLDSVFELKSPITINSRNKEFMQQKNQLLLFLKRFLSVGTIST